MVIEVIQQDIDEGMRGSCYSCPVANALSRITNKSFVVGNTIFREYGQFDKEWKIPKEVKELIDRYDSTGVMYPFKFKLRIKL